MEAMTATNTRHMEAMTAAINAMAAERRPPIGNREQRTSPDSLRNSRMNVDAPASVTSDISAMSVER